MSIKAFQSSCLSPLCLKTFQERVQKGRNKVRENSLYKFSQHDYLTIVIRNGTFHTNEYVNVPTSVNRNTPDVKPFVIQLLGSSLPQFVEKVLLGVSIAIYDSAHLINAHRLSRVLTSRANTPPTVLDKSFKNVHFQC